METTWLLAIGLNLVGALLWVALVAAAILGDRSEILSAEDREAAREEGRRRARLALAEADAAFLAEQDRIADLRQRAQLDQMDADLEELEASMRSMGMEVPTWDDE